MHTAARSRARRLLAIAAVGGMLLQVESCFVARNDVEFGLLTIVRNILVDGLTVVLTRLA